MTVNIDQLKRGITAYAEAELCPKVSGIGQFAAYFLLPSVSNIVEAKFHEFQASPLMADLFTENGLLELDEARDRASAALEKVGSLQVMGFRLEPSDADSLYEYIRRA